MIYWLGDLGPLIFPLCVSVPSSIIFQPQVFTSWYIVRIQWDGECRSAWHPAMLDQRGIKESTRAKEIWIKILSSLLFLRFDVCVHYKVISPKIWLPSITPPWALSQLPGQAWAGTPDLPHPPLHSSLGCPSPIPKVVWPCPLDSAPRSTKEKMINWISSKMFNFCSFSG